MAIYRLEKKSISRGSNHNLVAAIAYRAGAKLTDSNTLNPKATTHDYTKKTDVAHTEIILPVELAEQLAQAGITLDLEQVANFVEQRETTKRGKMKTTAKLASEYVLAGSHELSQAENIQAFQKFAKQQAEEQGVVTMVFVHDPKQGKDMTAGTPAADSQISKRTRSDRKKTSDIRNIHAHVVVLSRQFVLSGNQLQLGYKSNSELSDTDRKKKGLEKSREWLKGVREQWANIQNQSLESHNLAPVTHKSYKEIGVKFKPTKHLGKNASAIERMGLQTDLGKYNESINQYNRTHLESATERLTGLTEQRAALSQQRINESERGAEWTNEASEWTNEQISWAARSTGELNRRVASSKQRVELSKQLTGSSKHHIAYCNEQSDRTANRADSTKQRIELSKRWITANSKRAADSESSAHSINQGVTERAKPTPNTARQARAARLTEQKRRFNQRQEQFNKDTDRNRWTDERTADAARRIKIAMAMVFLSRHSGMALQPWEAIENHPEKLDIRQIRLLDDFAQSIGADSKVTDFSRASRQVADLFNANLIEQNIEIFKLLRNPAKEREQYNNRKPKTHLYAPQSNLNQSTKIDTNNAPKISDTLNDAIPLAPRHYRRP